VKRWALLLAGGAVWLFLAAIPTLADGGPHVAPANSGFSTLTADSCAGCHRAHTAQGAMLLAAPTEEALCLSCHGATGSGSTVDVESGIQYTVAARDVTSPVLGALRNGGFVEARIDSANPSRVTYIRSAGPPPATSQRTKVSVLGSGLPVTSAHIAFVGTAVVSQGTAWGNIAGTPGTTFDPVSNPGGTVSGLTCTSCHNPHGNGSYRILNPIPTPETITGDTFAPATTGINVTDAALPPRDADGNFTDTRNYTVIQTQGGTGTLLASQVLALPGYTNLMGDYFHRAVPWDPQVAYTAPPPAGVTSNDAPNGLAASFNGQINQWCSQCHSRYLAVTSAPYLTDSGDAIFKYRHSNTSNKPCTTCHVAHGTNAEMNGLFSQARTYPDGTPGGTDSRLLKIDNRGTCQACHDPTETVPAGTFYGPTPAPYVP
jgi:predicted CXXCH cytochrome family protein